MRGATDSDCKTWDFQLRSGRRHITQSGKNKSADRVDTFGINLKAEMFRQIIQTRISAHKEFAVAERLDVKLRTILWHGAAENFLDEILHRDDSLNAAEFVNYDAHALRMCQE